MVPEAPLEKLEGMKSTSGYMIVVFPTNSTAKGCNLMAMKGQMY